jgi:hypothetical protein
MSINILYLLCFYNDVTLFQDTRSTEVNSDQVEIERLEVHASSLRKVLVRGVKVAAQLG